MKKKSYVCTTSTSRLVSICGIVLSILAPGSVLYAQAQRDGIHRSARRAGAVNIHLAAGSTNGARLGGLWHISPTLAPELSFGYVLLNFTLPKNDGSDEEEVIRQDALAISGGVNYFLHTENEVSPLFSLLVTHTWATEMLNAYISQQRTSITPAVGAAIDLFSRVSFFFRVGPSIHILSRTETRTAQVHMHFDGGIGITF